MRTVQEVLEAARQLPPEERRRLIEELLDERDRLVEELQASQTATERRRVLSSWLGIAGIAHRDHSDLSSDKYKHLAAIYANNHESE